jgi:hypothetical protein
MSLKFLKINTQLKFSDVVFYVLSSRRDILFLSMIIVLLDTVVMVWAVVCPSMRLLLMTLYPVVV